MTGDNILTLIAMIKNNGGVECKRISVPREAQDKITKEFLRLKDNFTKNREEVCFNGGYRADVTEILKIDNFEIDDDIINAIQNPLTLDIMRKSDINSIKALFCGVWNNNSKYVLFQSFDSRKVLSKKKGIPLVHSNNTFKMLSEPIITIGNGLDAICENNKLLFISYHNAKKIFDLSEYYKEATNKDLEDFSKNELFDVKDLSWFIANADSEIRKKVALIQRNRILDVIDYYVLRDSAEELDISLPLDVDNEKIKFSNDKKEIKVILSFLNEDIFKSPLTNRRFFTNSKREFN